MRIATGGNIAPSQQLCVIFAFQCHEDCDSVLFSNLLIGSLVIFAFQCHEDCDTEYTRHTIFASVIFAFQCHEDCDSH